MMGLMLSSGPDSSNKDIMEAMMASPLETSVIDWTT